MDNKITQPLIDHPDGRKHQSMMDMIAVHRCLAPLGKDQLQPRFPHHVKRQCYFHLTLVHRKQNVVYHMGLVLELMRRRVS